MSRSITNRRHEKHNALSRPCLLLAHARRHHPRRAPALGLRPSLLLLALLAISGCSSGGSTPARHADCAAEMSCTATTPSIPDGWLAAQIAARDALRAEVDAGRVRIINAGMDWDTLPRIEWRPCPWFVRNADCNPTGSGCRDGKGVCAAGQTTDKGRRIIVSTLQPERTLPLVAHETRNAFLVRGGRPDLAY